MPENVYKAAVINLIPRFMAILLSELKSPNSPITRNKHYHFPIYIIPEKSSGFPSRAAVFSMRFS